MQKRQRLSPEILTSLLMAANQIDEDGNPLTDKLRIATTWCDEQGAMYVDDLDDCAQQELASTLGLRNIHTRKFREAIALAMQQQAIPLVVDTPLGGAPAVGAPLGVTQTQVTPTQPQTPTRTLTSTTTTRVDNLGYASQFEEEEDDKVDPIIGGARPIGGSLTIAGSSGVIAQAQEPASWERLPINYCSEAFKRIWVDNKYIDNIKSWLTTRNCARHNMLCACNAYASQATTLTHAAACLPPAPQAKSTLGIDPVCGLCFLRPGLWSSRSCSSRRARHTG